MYAFHSSNLSPNVVQQLPKTNKENSTGRFDLGKATVPRAFLYFPVNCIRFVMRKECCLLPDPRLDLYSPKEASDTHAKTGSPIFTPKNFSVSGLCENFTRFYRLAFVRDK